MTDPPPPPKKSTFAIVVLVVSLILLLVAATIYAEITDPPATAPAPTVTVTASLAVAPDPENEFVATARERTNRYDISFDKFVGLGRGICTDLDDGKSLMVAMSQLYADDLFSAEDSGAIVAAAVFYLCPRHLPSDS